MVYQTAPFSFFNDLERPLTWFSRSILWHWISNKRLQIL